MFPDYLSVSYDYDLKNVTDNSEFWKTVKPFLFDKITAFSKKSLVEKR